MAVAVAQEVRPEEYGFRIPIQRRGRSCPSRLPRSELDADGG
jgi:hypothetical protein